MTDCYLRKPVSIHAFQWIKGVNFEDPSNPQWITDAFKKGKIQIFSNVFFQYIIVENDGENMKEGHLNDYIVLESDGYLDIIKESTFLIIFNKISICEACGNEYLLKYDDSTDSWHGNCCGVFVSERRGES